MDIAAKAVLGLVAVLHVYFFVLESVLWGRPRTNKVFGVSAEQAAHAAVFAKNQGVYNLFLVAGLLWSFAHPDPQVGRQLALFFGGCVVVAGAVGGWTANPRIFVVQAVPAFVGVGLTLAVP
ncbi:MAG: DUF1304 domain-containing protein [Deltaproteobacteria bacterium]|nr:DUF1304 domain-containing protein [Deltaproteobacteria bacterium]